MSSSPYPCPACGFLVFDGPVGSYALCPICDWEDDGVQFMHPYGGGANHMSLIDWQKSALAAWPVNVTELHGYARDAQWRPLEPRDLIDGYEGPLNALAYEEWAANDGRPRYY